MASNQYTYKIDENNAILIFDSERLNEDGSPNLFQPWHPSSMETPWASKEEAEAFAKEWIEELINPAPVVAAVVIEEDDPSVIESE